MKELPPLVPGAQYAAGELTHPIRLANAGDREAQACLLCGALFNRPAAIARHLSFHVRRGQLTRTTAGYRIPGVTS